MTEGAGDVVRWLIEGQPSGDGDSIRTWDLRGFGRHDRDRFLSSVKSAGLGGTCLVDIDLGEQDTASIAERIPGNAVELRIHLDEPVRCAHMIPTILQHLPELTAITIRASFRALEKWDYPDAYLCTYAGLSGLCASEVDYPGEDKDREREMSCYRISMCRGGPLEVVKLYANRDYAWEWATMTIPDAFAKEIMGWYSRSGALKDIKLLIYGRDHPDWMQRWMEYSDEDED